MQDNDLEISSAHNKGKSAVAEKPIKIWKTKFCKFKISNNVYIDKFNDKVNKYNKIFHNINKMDGIDVDSSPYIGFSIENVNKTFT